MVSSYGSTLGAFPSGQLPWAAAEDKATCLFYQPSKVSELPRLFVGGSFSGTALFGDRYHSAEGNHTYGFVCLVDPANGTILDSASLPSTHSSAVRDLTVDTSGRLLALGSFEGLVSFEDLRGDTHLKERFLAEFDADYGPLSDDLNLSFVSDRAGFKDQAVALLRRHLGRSPPIRYFPKPETGEFSLDEGSDFPEFHTRLENELQIEDNSSRYHFFKGFHGLLEILESSEIGSLKHFAIELGLEKSFLFFSLSDSPMLGSYDFSLNPEFQLGRLAEFFQNSLVPDLVQTDAHLARVIEPVVIDSNFSGMDEELVVDQADIAMLRTLVHLLAGVASLQSGYDWDVRIGLLQEREQGLSNYTLEDLRRDHPQLLGVRDASQLALGREHLQLAIDQYQIASPCSARGRTLCSGYRGSTKPFCSPSR